MGDIKDMVNMIPGASKAMGDTEIDNDSFKHIEALIYSMTPKERSNPKIIDVSRKKRISKGSGLDVQELNKLLKQFEQMSKMMKMMQGGGASRMMQMMKGMK
jgi:signal recognition particle subunit SRP54